VTTYTDSSVALNTTYYYRVRAYNVVATSAFSNTATAATPAQIVPLAPTFLLIMSTTRNSFALMWTDNAANELGFYLERSTAGASGPWTRIATVLPKAATAPSSVTYTDNFLTPATNYWYRVQAYNLVGGSAYSNTIPGTTNP
jgi:hypothetical protein